ncbi:hypothetical protein O181_055383 [Austropuccinia psidii MF-1]|uniref:Uncharacterized protein n=1 Tax=Austropuccinia psidii MF-1 TaxID=1389203 RepID=A0A9Q3EB20_9BASI|nr:hypothetical protein [Austropuccinia psidii MF-1]
MPQIPGNAKELNQLPTSASKNGSKISDMVSSNELGIEVESLVHENNQDPQFLPECEHKFMLNINNLSKPDFSHSLYFSSAFKLSKAKFEKLSEGKYSVTLCTNSRFWERQGSFQE